MQSSDQTFSIDTRQLLLTFHLLKFTGLSYFVVYLKLELLGTQPNGSNREKQQTRLKRI